MTDNVALQGTPLPVKLSKITRFEEQPRQNFDPKSLEALSRSIELDGQQMPIKVTYGEKGSFKLIDGERRWRAFHLIQERTKVEPTVLCFIEVANSESERYRKAIVANLHREDLSPLDEAYSLKQVNDDGMSKADICKLIDKSISYVNNRIKLTSLPDEVKALMDPALPRNRQLSVTSAIDIALATRNPKVQIELAKEAVEAELGVTDLRNLIILRTTSIQNSRSSITRRLGLKRSSDEDYKRLKSFLGRTIKNSNEYASSASVSHELLVSHIFDYRIEESKERETAVAEIDTIIENLMTLRGRIKEEKQ